MRCNIWPLNYVQQQIMELSNYNREIKQGNCVMKLRSSYIVDSLYRNAFILSDKKVRKRVFLKTPNLTILYYSTKSTLIIC